MNTLLCAFTYSFLQLYVRANFDYTPRDDKYIPTIDVGLEFKKGDILKILSQDETHWWQVSDILTV